MNSLANRTGNKFAITGRLIRDNRECFPVAREALGPCLRVVFVGRLAALSGHRARIAERARRLPQEISCQSAALQPPSERRSFRVSSHSTPFGVEGSA